MQEIFKATPHDKQVMMFSATLSAEVRPVCKKFMTDVCPSPARPPSFARRCRPLFQPTAFPLCQCRPHALGRALVAGRTSSPGPHACEGVA